MKGAALILCLLLEGASVLMASIDRGVRECSSNGFRACDDGVCLPEQWFCDGQPECKNGEDEDPRNCPDAASRRNTFSPSVRRAPKSRIGFPERRQPLPIVSPNQQDSTSVSHGPCPPEYFHCDYKCYHESYRCDGWTHCTDGSDEENCGTPAPVQGNVCSKDELQCFDGKCISISQVCDGEVNCGYHEDEFACAFRKEKNNNFSHQCIRNCLGIITPTCNNTTTKSSRQVYATTTTTERPTGTCDNDYNFVHDRCLQINFFPPKNWYEAREDCVDDSATLLEIDDLDFFVELYDYLNISEHQTYAYWAGGFKDTEGYHSEWKWASSDKPIYLKTPLWTQSESNSGTYIQAPDGGEDEKCTLLESCPFRYLNDEKCEKAKPYICQKAASYYSRDRHLVIHREYNH